MAGLCFLLPDLIDKPLWLLGVIPDGRYMGHTLLMALVVAFVLATVKWTYGLLALCAWMPHLFFDTSGRSYNPWFYPFRHYDFTPYDYHFVLTLDNLLLTALELLAVLVAIMAIWALLWIAAQLLGRRPGTGSAGGEGMPVSDPPPAHGGALCWTARIAGTLLSASAVAILLAGKARYDSAWPTVPAALCVVVLTVCPSVAAWWSHRTGGAFCLVVCLAYALLAYEVVEEADRPWAVVLFLVVWVAAAALHLVSSWREPRTSGEPLTMPRSRA